ncbi:DUF4169 family protein [Magnetovibrio sp. PR-2]|uniref:DUF4169 family protein n=1 Tax=Magnetovibrio sp. PR-2 TaxID=3120356 RepID=UPI002FCE5001
MSDVVNLNKFRKTKARADKDKRASENRVKFGRTKAEKQAENTNQALIDKKLKGKKLGDDDQDPT